MSFELTTLDSVCHVLNGFAFKSEEYVDSGIRVIRITNVQKGRIHDDDPKFVSADRSKEFSRFLLSEGDLLISLTGNVGRVGVLAGAMLPAALNQRVGALKVRSEKIDRRYLFHILNSETFEREAIKNSKGIAQLNLSSKWVEKYEIRLPPLEEQRRIAEVLDKADGLRQKRRLALQKLDTLLHSVFLEMFGDPALNSKRLSTVRLGDIGKWQSGGTPSRSRTDYFNGQIPWFSSGELESREVTKSREHISVAAIKETTARSVAKGSLMLGMYDTAALKASFAGLDCSCNQAIAFALLDEAIVVPDYVYFAIKIGREHFRRLQRGVRQKNLNLSMIKEIAIPKPTVSDQRLFGKFVISSEKAKARQLESLRILDSFMAGLQQIAFSGLRFNTSASTSIDE